MRALVLSVLALSLLNCSSPKKVEQQPVLPKTIEEAVSSNYRKPENLARDQYRHPVETLKFFGLQPNMKVVEISPGNGWYTEILAPLINGGGGEYIGAPPVAAGNEYVTKMNEGLRAWLAARPEIKAQMIEWAVPLDKEKTAATVPGGTPINADMVLTFRNVHNWMKAGNSQQMFHSFFAALKPGGVLGVVEHRANEKGKYDPAKTGYVKQSEVIRMANKAGFILDAQSEVNANSKDTKNHPEGVWTLPPSLRLKEVDREKYVAIGESDRMTLRFVKPAAASTPAPSPSPAATATPGAAATPAATPASAPTSTPAQ